MTFLILIMNLIDKQLETINKQGRLGIMTHVVAGYPNIAESRKIINAMAKAGVDFIEIQIPFSDPMGDGATIRVANTKALAKGFKTKNAFELVRKLRQDDKIETPLLFMTYFNIIFNYGIEKFCRDSKAAGINGLIVPDYPNSAESRDHLQKHAQNNNLNLIPFLSLDSTTETIKNISKTKQGFVYCFSLRGITGARDKILQELTIYLNKIKKQIKLPIGVGFGISAPEHISELKNKTDIVIIGSALIKAYDNGGINNVEKKLKLFINIL